MKFSDKSHDELIAQWIEVSALKRIVDPKYVIRWHYYSDEVAMITGEDINVKAGNLKY